MPFITLVLLFMLLLFLSLSLQHLIPSTLFIIPLLLSSTWHASVLPSFSLVFFSFPLTFPPDHCPPPFIYHSSPLVSSSRYSPPLYGNHPPSSSCHPASPLISPLMSSHRLSSSDSTHHISFPHCSPEFPILFCSPCQNLLRHLHFL